MKRTLFAAMALVAAAAGGDDAGLIVRTSASGRTWQVSWAPAEPIVWVWPDKATAATLTVTSYVGRTSVAVFDIARETGAETGGWTLPVPARPTASGEYLYDLALAIRNGTKTIETLSARVVVLPEAFDLLVADSGAWRNVSDRDARPIPYDAAWATNGAPLALAFTPEDGETVSVALAGTSGWEPPDLRARLGDWNGPFTAVLAFDGTDVFSAALVRRLPGLALKFR